MLTTGEKEEFARLIAGATVEAIKAHQCVEGELHQEEHAWLRERIQKERDRADFYRKVGQAVFGTVIAAALLWVGSQGLAFIHFILRSAQAGGGQ